MKTEKNEIAILINECLKKNAKAQHALYQKYANAMYSTAVRMLGETPEAEDALQEAFINAFRNLKKFDARVTFGAWLKRITINVCLNKLRKKKLNWLELDFDIPEETSEHEIQLDPVLLNAAIEKLPTGCRTVFTLKAIEGYKHEEIANELNISLSTSKSQYIRAKELLNYSLKKLIRL